MCRQCSAHILTRRSNVQAIHAYICSAAAYAHTRACRAREQHTHMYTRALSGGSTHSMLAVRRANRHDAVVQRKHAVQRSHTHKCVTHTHTHTHTHARARASTHAHVRTQLRKRMQAQAVLQWQICVVLQAMQPCVVHVQGTPRLPHVHAQRR